MKIKTEQIELFPELKQKFKFIKEGKCRVCQRPLKNGIIGSGCRARIKKEISLLKKILEG